MAKRKPAKRGPKKLNDRIRAELVTMFACHHKADEVAAWLKETHAIELEPSSLSYYNGGNPGAYHGLSKKWRKLFDDMREEYLSVVKAPIAFKAHRLKVANDAVEKIIAKLDGRAGVNVVMVEKLQALLEYAAREDGGMFTNRRILEHDPRGSLAALLGCDPSDLPDDGGDAKS